MNQMILTRSEPQLAHTLLLIYLGILDFRAAKQEQVRALENQIALASAAHMETRRLFEEAQWGAEKAEQEAQDLKVRTRPESFGIHGMDDVSYTMFGDMSERVRKSP